MTRLLSDVKFFWEVFVTLLVITDPPGIVPVFLGMTGDRSAAERKRLAWQAAVVALGVIIVFAVFGRSILGYLGVQLPSLQAAGGLLLLLVALELLTGKAADPAELEKAKANVAFVPLGTPLLAGPGRDRRDHAFRTARRLSWRRHRVQCRYCRSRRRALAGHAVLRGHTQALAGQRR